MEEEGLDSLPLFLTAKLNYSKYPNQSRQVTDQFFASVGIDFDKAHQLIAASFGQISREQPNDIFIGLEIEQLLGQLNYLRNSKDQFWHDNSPDMVRKLFDEVKAFSENVFQNVHTNQKVVETIQRVEELVGSFESPILELTNLFAQIENEMSAKAFPEESIRLLLAQIGPFASKQFKIINRLQQFELYYVISEDDLTKIVDSVDPETIDPKVIVRRSRECISFFGSISGLLENIDVNQMLSGDIKAVA
jgi:hypothetical protein